MWCKVQQKTENSIIFDNLNKVMRIKKCSSPFNWKKNLVEACAKIQQCQLTGKYWIHVRCFLHYCRTLHFYVFTKRLLWAIFFFNFNSLYLWFCDQFFQRVFFEINFWSPTLVSSTSMHIQQFPLQFVTLFSCIILNMVTLVKFLKLPSHQMWFFLSWI